MSAMVDYRTDAQGRRRRVHRVYVDVVARFGADGGISPVYVMWQDGRSFRVDEVVEHGEFGAETRGCRQARYRVRIGRTVTDLWLELRSAVPALSQNACMRWWVYAYDQTKPGHAPAPEK